MSNHQRPAENAHNSEVTPALLTAEEINTIGRDTVAAWSQRNAFDTVARFGATAAARDHMTMTTFGQYTLLGLRDEVVATYNSTKADPAAKPRRLKIEAYRPDPRGELGGSSYIVWARSDGDRETTDEPLYVLSRQGMRIRHIPTDESSLRRLQEDLAIMATVAWVGTQIVAHREAVGTLNAELGGHMIDRTRNTSVISLPITSST